jgi:hypothetical protein
VRKLFEIEQHDVSSPHSALTVAEMRAPAGIRPGAARRFLLILLQEAADHCRDNPGTR